MFSWRCLTSADQVRVLIEEHRVHPYIRVYQQAPELRFCCVFIRVDLDAVPGVKASTQKVHRRDCGFGSSQVTKCIHLLLTLLKSRRRRVRVRRWCLGPSGHPSTEYIVLPFSFCGNYVKDQLRCFADGMVLCFGIVPFADLVTVVVNPTRER